MDDLIGDVDGAVGEVRSSLVGHGNLGGMKRDIVVQRGGRERGGGVRAGGEDKRRMIGVC